MSASWRNLLQNYFGPQTGEHFSIRALNREF
jgi:hypothetical protein